MDIGHKCIQLVLTLLILILLKYLGHWYLCKEYLNVKLCTYCIALNNIITLHFHHLKLSGDLHWIPVEFLHRVGDDLVHKVLVLCRELGHHGQREGVVPVVHVGVLNLIVKETVGSAAVLCESLILEITFMSSSIIPKTRLS